MSFGVPLFSFSFLLAGGIHTLSSRGNSEKRHDSQEKLTDLQSPMASSSRGTGSEDNDSDFDNQSHDDEIDNEEEQINLTQHKEEEEEEHKQLIVRTNTFRVFFSRRDLFSYDNRRFFGVLNKNGYEKRRVILNNWRKWNNK